MDRRGWIKNAVASAALVVVAFTPVLNEQSAAALFGAFLVAPFVLIAERWRRHHVRKAAERPADLEP